MTRLQRTALLVIVASLQLIWIATSAAPSLLQTVSKSASGATLVATVQCLAQQITSNTLRMLLPPERA